MQDVVLHALSMLLGHYVSYLYVLATGFHTCCKYLQCQCERGLPPMPVSHHCHCWPWPLCGCALVFRPDHPPALHQLTGRQAIWDGPYLLPVASRAFRCYRPALSVWRLPAVHHCLSSMCRMSRIIMIVTAVQPHDSMADRCSFLQQPAHVHQHGGCSPSVRSLLGQRVPRTSQRVLHQHRNRHWADATRHRRDVGSLGSHLRGR